MRKIYSNVFFILFFASTAVGVRTGADLVKQDFEELHYFPPYAFIKAVAETAIQEGPKASDISPMQNANHPDGEFYFHKGVLTFTVLYEGLRYRCELVPYHLQAYDYAEFSKDELWENLKGLNMPTDLEDFEVQINYALKSNPSIKARYSKTEFSIVVKPLPGVNQAIRLGLSLDTVKQSFRLTRFRINGWFAGYVLDSTYGFKHALHVPILLARDKKVVADLYEKLSTIFSEFAKSQEAFEINKRNNPDY